MSRFSPMLVLALVVVAAGWNWPTSAATGTDITPTNAMCPVMPDEPVDPAQFLVVEGQHVYFCCKRCRARFERDPQLYEQNLIQVMFAAAADRSEAELDRDQEDAHSNEDNHVHDHGVEAAGFVGKLISWLGNFHPPMVNFPIGLLTAAAVAELMLIMTGKPLFDGASRFCLWFGTLGAVAAATLGWLYGGFHLTDADWLLTTHRWLGTSTALWAIVTLVLSQKAHGHEGQKWLGRYRLALLLGVALVSITGFFGGAMLYGLNHYAW